MQLRMLGILAIVAAGSRADADNAKLAEARRELAAVHYDRARVLLVEALEAGGSSPAEVREIYQLSASTAVVLGQPDVAEQFDRRWLALDPHAALGADESPKVHAPFEAAQAFIQAHGGLVVTAVSMADAVDVAVISDPLVMAAAAAFAGDPPVRFDPSRHARLVARAGRVAILDDRGNHLVEIDVAPRPAPPRQVDEPPRSHGWLAWAIPAGAFVGTAIGFGITALAYQNEISDTVGHSGDHFASDVTHERDRARLFAYMSAGAFAVGVGLAIPAIYYRPGSVRTMLSPLGRGAGISVAW